VPAKPFDNRLSDEASAGAPTGAMSGESSFDEFYAERWPQTVRLAFAIVANAETAEEVAQEGFIRVHERWIELRSPDAFLRTVVVNLCRSHLRRQRVVDRHRPDAQRGVLDAPELDETWLAVCRLPFRQRAVLALRYYADLSEAEIAQVLGCRLGTVKSARSRALAALRKELG
jgi:RNA polymerase sigma-70 factor (sigma-E family)